jgi:multiple sugar transport system permease protein
VARYSATGSAGFVGGCVIPIPFLLEPLIYLNDQSKFTLALGLANMQSAIGLSDFGAIMAAATVTVVPVTIVFIFTQRYFIEGILTARAKS